MTAPAKRMKRSEVPFDTRKPFELGEKAAHPDPRSRSASPPLTPVDWRVTYDGGMELTRFRGYLTTWV